MRAVPKMLKTCEIPSKSALLHGFWAILQRKKVKNSIEKCGKEKGNYSYDKRSKQKSRGDHQHGQ